MNPAHRARLPVSKPIFDRRTKDNYDRVGPAEPEKLETLAISFPIDELPDSSSDLAKPLLAAESNPQTESGRNDGRWTLPPASLPVAISPGKQVFAERIEIEVEPEERRPFELGDLLTREFAAQNSSFLISIAVHTLTLLLLSLVLIHSTGKALISLELFSSPDIEEFAGVIAELDVDINDVEELVAAVDQDPFHSAFGDSDGDQTVTDASQVAGSEGGGNKSKGQGDGKSAKFFGMRAIGNKFVYVLDRSGSMAYEASDVPKYQVSRFDVARMELMNSVESLRPHQEFYVVLFSTGMRQMFNRNDLVPTAVKATPENKVRLKEWLWRDQANGGTDPRGGLKLAFKMNPDAIFMLSDGEFRDEKNDGNPLAIDLARKQVEENKPIRINSIALEDDASKVNMEELSNVSGGQFKFVKVRDYISNMAKPPADFFRSRVPDQSHLQTVVSWSERDALAKQMVGLLDSRTYEDRRDAELRLHELSFGIFESVIPAVAGSDFDPEATAESIKAWTVAWETANDQTDLDASTPIGLFSVLATVANKNYIESVKSLDVTTLTPFEQISVARSVLEFQRGNGVTGQSRAVFLDYLRELNKQSTAEFNEERFLKGATQTTCQRRLVTVLKNRRLRASRLYGQTKNKGLHADARIEIAKHLIVLYPETKVAKQAAESFNLPVSHLNETE